MRIHEVSQEAGSERAHKPTVPQRTGRSSSGIALTPHTILHLQRTAGNAAVAAEIAVQRDIAVQRKKSMYQFDSGTLNGIITIDGKDHPASMLNITDGWLSPGP